MKIRLGIRDLPGHANEFAGRRFEDPFEATRPAIRGDFKSEIQDSRKSPITNQQPPISNELIDDEPINRWTRSPILELNHQSQITHRQ